MPPGKAPKLADAQIATIRKWIDQGAITAHPEKSASATLVTEKDRQFWSFQRLRRSDNTKKLATDETRNQHGSESVIDPCSIRGRNAWCRTPIEAEFGFCPQCGRPIAVVRLYQELIERGMAEREARALLIRAGFEPFS